MTKFNNPFLPKFDLVVTRHAGLVEWLLGEGHIDADTPVVEHAHADRIEAKAIKRSSGWFDVVAGSRVLEQGLARGLAVPWAREHNAANVRGKHVIGVLPHHLSCEAASITKVQLDIEPSQRGRELSVDETVLAVRGLHTYRVSRVDGEPAEGGDPGGFEAPDGPADPPAVTFDDQADPPSGWSLDPEHGNRLVSDGVDITIFDDMVRVDADSQPRSVSFAAIDWLRAKLSR